MLCLSSWLKIIACLHSQRKGSYLQEGGQTTSFGGKTLFINCGSYWIWGPNKTWGWQILFLEEVGGKGEIIWNLHSFASSTINIIYQEKLHLNWIFLLFFKAKDWVDLTKLSIKGLDIKWENMLRLKKVLFGTTLQTIFYHFSWNDFLPGGV